MYIEIYGKTGEGRRKEWKMVHKRLCTVCRDFEIVCTKIDYEAGFADMNWRLKRGIFETLIRRTALCRTLKYIGQEEDCKRVVQCKVVCKSWKYWISRSTSGVEMRENIIDIDM